MHEFSIDDDERSELLRIAQNDSQPLGIAHFLLTLRAFLKGGENGGMI